MGWALDVVRAPLLAQLQSRCRTYAEGSLDTWTLTCHVAFAAFLTSELRKGSA
jgi:hypothetical protein